MKKNKIDVTVESHEVVILRKSNAPVQAWCAQCGAQVRMITSAEAALLAGVSSRAIYRQIEGGRLHFTETPDSSLLICLNSLTSESGHLPFRINCQRKGEPL